MNTVLVDLKLSIFVHDLQDLENHLNLRFLDINLEQVHVNAQLDLRLCRLVLIEHLQMSLQSHYENKMALLIDLWKEGFLLGSTRYL